MRVKSGEHVTQRSVEEPAIMPEGGAISSSHAHPRQVLVALQLVGDEFAKIRVPGRLPAEIRVGEEPLFPGERLGVMEFVHEL